MKLKRLLLLAVGGLSVALGSAGTVIPVLPTVPFFLLAALCFAKSSEELHQKLVNSKLYRENIEPYLGSGGMSKGRKVRIMVTVTALMAGGLILSRNILPLFVLLIAIWVIHAYVLIFRIKSVEAKPGEKKTA
jgi:uncharacterized membrane protein YbaN (DUF454 family)